MSLLHLYIHQGGSLPELPESYYKVLQNLARWSFPKSSFCIIHCVSLKGFRSVARGKAFCAAHQTDVFCLSSERCVLRPCHISYTSILMALWHTPHSFLWTVNRRWWNSFFRYIVTSVNVPSVTAATGPCAEAIKMMFLYISVVITTLFSDHADGRIKLWVYGLTAGGFILILLIIAVAFLFWYVCYQINTLITEWKDNTCLKTVCDSG